MLWAILLVATLLAVALMPVSVSLTYQAEGRRQALLVDASLFVWHRQKSWQLRLPEVSLWAALQGDGRHWQRLQQAVVLLQNVTVEDKVLLYLLTKLRIRRLRVLGRVGLGDAAVTSLAFGLLWAVAGTCAALAQSLWRLREAPVIDLHAVFGERRFDVSFQCIASLRIGQISLAMGYLLGYRLWQTVKRAASALRGMLAARSSLSIGE